MAMRTCPKDEAKFLAETKQADPFATSREKFEGIVAHLRGPSMSSATHSAIEEWLDVEGRELLRRLVQDHLTLRAAVEPKRLAVVGSEGTARREVVKDEGRPLNTIFGDVGVARLAYRAPRKEVGNLMPLDLELNLPPGLFSFGLQRRAAIEIAKSSFESTQESIKDRTGVVIGKKQLEDMASEMATDFDTFYAIRSTQAQAGLAAIFGSPRGMRSPEGLDRSKFLVLTTDGKGVAVIEEDLREDTRKAAQKRREKHEKTDPVPETKVPKLYRRRTAQVCAVYTVAPFCRKPEDIIREMRHVQPIEQRPKRPKPEDKRVWASVEKDAEPTVGQAFDEASLRDPKRELTWLGVVDGALEQMRIIRRQQKRLGVSLILILDFIHVAGYVWKASYAFHERGSEAAREWVDVRLLAILQGKASDVAAGIRRSATIQGLSKSQRKHVDACCDYILGHADMMRYDEYLAAGYPIGSGVIEGACRHLLQDRLDLSGATWTVQNAEAVLKLRALRCSHDFDEYWQFHEEQELQRNHLARFSNAKPPPLPTTRRTQTPSLRVVPVVP
jgi:hypothetical protein